MPAMKRSAVTGKFITKNEGRALSVTTIKGKGQEIRVVNRVAAETALRKAGFSYLSHQGKK
jgi:hypothetical protein